MGCNLFKVPLGLLVAQAEDTRIHLVAMEPVRDAFVAAEQDLAGLERELAAAAAVGSAAARAVALAREAVRLEGVEQRSICSAYAGWCARVRRRLGRAQLSD